MKKIILATLLLGVLVIWSCQKLDDAQNITIQNDPEYAFPLINSSVSIDDILGNKNIQALNFDEKGNLILHYEGQVGQKNASDFFTFFSNVPFLMSDSSVILPYKSSQDLDIKKVVLKKGSIRFGCQAKGITEPVEIEFTMPQLKKNNLPFTQKFTTSYLPGTGAVVIPQPKDISGYELELTTDSIYLKYKARIKGTNKAVKLDYAGGQLEDIEFSFIKAYMNSRVVDVPGEDIDIKLFNNFVGGKITFADPTITLSVDNSFGFPIGSVTKYLRVIAPNGKLIDLESPYVNKPIKFDYPSLSEVGKSKITSFKFNTQNSNIADILTSNPKTLSYDIDANLNPDSIKVIGFMTDSSRYKIRVAVDLPLYGTANGFEASQVFKVNFEQLSEVREAEVKLIAENKMPLSVNAQFYFRDSGGVVLDSLFKTPQALFAGAPVDATANVTAANITTLFAGLDEPKMNRLRATKDMLGKFYFSTTDKGSKNVRVLKSQDIKIRMGVKAKVNVF